MRDKETIEIALEAAETGHLVLSTLHTIDASKTVERIIGAFPLGEQHIIRNRLAKSFQAIVSQRLIPRKDGGGRMAIVEILKSTLRTREYVERGEQDGKTLLEAMTDGMPSLISPILCHGRPPCTPKLEGQRQRLRCKTSS